MSWVPACGRRPVITIIPGARAQLAPHRTGRQGRRGQRPHCPWKGSAWPWGASQEETLGWVVEGAVGKAHEA